MKNSLKGIILIALAAFFWSLSGVFVKILTGIDATVILFYRVFFASLFLFVIWSSLKKRPELIPKKKKFHIFLLGIFCLLTGLCFINSVIYTTISTATFLFYTAPAFLIIFARIFLNEKIKKISIFSLFISLVGVFFVSGAQLSSLLSLGITFGLLGGVVYSIQLLLSKIVSKYYSGIMPTLWQSLIATVLLLPFFVLPSLQQLFILMVYGITVSGIGVACYYEGIKYVKMQVAGILILLDPVFAITWSIFLFNEPLTLMEIIGGTLILAAIIIQVIFARDKNDSEKV